MRRLALALLLATPLAAGAQYADPYGHPPHPRPRGYSPAPLRYGYQRQALAPPVRTVPRGPPLSPFYFDLGLGAGTGETYLGNQTTSLSGGLAYHLEAGARLTPQLLLGLGVAGLGQSGGGSSGGGQGVSLIDYDAVVTLFPFVQGLFLRGGAGLSSLAITDPATGLGGVNHLGTNVLLGAGWAFPTASPLALTLGIDWSHQSFWADDVTGSSVWAMRAGIGFY